MNAESIDGKRGPWKPVISRTMPSPDGWPDVADEVVDPTHRLLVSN